MTRARLPAEHRPRPPRHAGGLSHSRYVALTAGALWPVVDRIPRATVYALAAILEAEGADAAAIVARCQGWRRALREHLDAGGRLSDAAPLPPDWTPPDGAAAA